MAIYGLNRHYKKIGPLWEGGLLKLPSGLCFYELVWLTARRIGPTDAEDGEKRQRRRKPLPSKSKFRHYTLNAFWGCTHNKLLYAPKWILWNGHLLHRKAHWAQHSSVYSHFQMILFSIFLRLLGGASFAKWVITPGSNWMRKIWLQTIFPIQILFLGFIITPYNHIEM